MMINKKCTSENNPDVFRTEEDAKEFREMPDLEKAKRPEPEMRDTTGQGGGIIIVCDDFVARRGKLALHQERPPRSGRELS